MAAKKTFEVTKHILVPQHKKISEADKKDLFAKYHITIAELPKILVKDPAIADLKLKTGDVVKITRESPTAGKSYYYRCVTDG